MGISGRSSEDDVELAPSTLPMEEKTERVLSQLYPCALSMDQPAGEGSTLAGVSCGGVPAPLRRKTPKSREPRALSDSGLGRPHGPASPSAGMAGGSHGPGSPSGEEMRRSAQQRLVWCRQRLLDEHSTMNAAFDSLAGQRGLGRELSRREFGRIMGKHLPRLSQEAQNEIFNHLVEDERAVISMMQLRIGIEAAIPVRSIEDLRRRLITLGFLSMSQALVCLQDEKHSSHNRRLSCAQFSSALTSIGITDYDEHCSIFNALCDPNAGSPATVSINDLFSALAAVSPSLLLEELRQRLLKQHESLAEACDALGIKASVAMDSNEFVHAATEAWKLSPAEAGKAFRAIDILRRSHINRGQIIRALQLAEPCLVLEEVRRRVRQRFLSIHKALQDSDPAFAASMSRCTPAWSCGSPARQLADRATTPEQKQRLVERPAGPGFPSRRMTAGEFRTILAAVQLPEADTQLIFNILGSDHESRLSVEDFAWGIQAMGSACCLESLRLRCLTKHVRVADAFVGLAEDFLGLGLDAADLQDVLQARDLRGGIDGELLLDVIEPLSGNGTSVSGLVAALQAAAPGHQAPLSPEKRIAKAQHLVQGEMAPFHQSVKDARVEVRRRPRRDPDGRRRAFEALSCSEQQPHQQRSCSSPARRYQHRRDTQGCAPWKASLAGKQSKDEVMLQEESACLSPPMQQSFSKVSDMLKIVASKDILQTSDSAPFLERLHGYYTTAGSTMASDTSLLATSQSRLQAYRNTSGHYHALGRTVL